MAKNLKYSVMLDVYGAMLTDKQRDMMELYYDEDLSLAEIAEHEGISRQGVRDSIKRGEEAMEELEEKLGIIKKAQQAEEKQNVAKAELTKLATELAGFNMTREYGKRLHEIIENNF